MEEEQLFEDIFYAHDEWFKISGSSFFNKDKTIKACDKLINSIELYKSHIMEN